MTTATELPQRVEFGIVGGGLIGLALAYELTMRHRSVVVFDDTRPGNSSRAAAGMVAAAAEVEVEHAGFIALRRWSRELYPEFVERVEADSGIDCAFRTTGTIVVALDRDHSAEIARLREIVHAQGFDSAALSAREVLELEPNLSGRVVEGLRLPQDFHIDQRRFLQALLLAVTRSGGTVTSDVTVEHVDADGHIHGHRSGARSEDRFDVQCDQVILAAGSWTSVGLELPFEALPVRPVRGQVVRLQADAVIRHVVRTPDVYLVPHAGGELVVGASVEEQGFDAQPTAGAVLDLLRHAWRAVPGLYDAPLREIAVGFRPTARDHLPVIGRVTPHVAVATGHFRNGILLAPGTARLLAQLLCDDVQPELLHDFDPKRFAAVHRREEGESCVESA